MSAWHTSHLRERHAFMQAECDALLEEIEHRESGSTEPHCLRELQLGIRTSGALHRDGIFNIRILREQTRADIERIRTIGVKTADEIEMALLVHGYVLQPPADEEEKATPA